jgi:hypothetical protein
MSRGSVEPRLFSSPLCGEARIDQVFVFFFFFFFAREGLREKRLRVNEIAFTQSFITTT